MKRTVLGSTLAASMLVAATAAADAPQWVDRRTVPDAKVAGSVDLGFGLGSRVLRVAGNDIRYTGVGWNFEGAISFLRRIELGLRFGVRAPFDGRVAQADTFARPFDRNVPYYYSTGDDIMANPEFRVRGKLVDTGGFELALEGRLYAPIARGTRFGQYFGVPMQFHAGIFRADVQPGFNIGFYDPSLFFVFSVPVNLWFQVTRKVFLGPLTGIRIYDRDYWGGNGGQIDLMLGFGVGVSFTPWFDLKTQILFERLNAGADWFGAGVAAGFNFGPG